MRSTHGYLVALVIALSVPLAAQEAHKATPWEQLLAEHHHMPASATPRIAAPYIATLDVTAAATKTFNVTASAQTFTFSFNPSPFVVNRGDTVTLHISCPSNDPSSPGGHGFFLENYMDQSVTIAKGRTVDVTFIANVAGTFTYVCTFTCGVGHGNMFGTFTVNDVALPPTISSVAPTSAPTTGGTLVTINGTDFQNGATVKFAGANAVSVTFFDSTRLSATTPVGTAGPAAITVTNPDSQSATFNGFSYTAPAPTVTSVTPSTGTTAGGTTITIAGTGFQSGATVKIGGVAATNVVFVSATQLTAVTPLGPANDQATVPKDVTVTNPDGQSGTRSGGFTYTVPPPAIATVSPSSGAPTGGNTVTITGAGFTSALTSSVTFGGTAGTNVQIVDAVTLTVVAPAHAAGTVDVAVRIGTNTATKTGAYAYVDTPKRRRATK